MEYKSEVTHEDSDFIYGNELERENQTKEFRFIKKFMKPKTIPWFTETPHKIFAKIGVEMTDSRRANDLSNFFEGNIDCYYYVNAASDGTDEASKWILGAVAAHINENGLSVKNIRNIIPADYIFVFIEYLKTGKFEKNFSKEIFAILLSKGVVFVSDDFSDRRVTGYEILDEIIADPKFKAADASEIDAIIEEIVTSNPDNVAKLVDQPRLFQWFVGQTMKASKGKANAQTVQDKLKLRLNVA